MAIIEKEYLDYAGLEEYDVLIKDYIAKTGDSNVTEVTNALEELRTALTAAINKETTDRQTDVERLDKAIKALEALVGKESVQKVVEAAIAEVIGGAPEAFDTLKEIADWIEEHGQGAAALIQSVSELSARVDTVDAKVDEAFAAIKSIPSADIKALFLTPVTVAEGKTITEAITSLGENEKLVLAADSTVDEAVTISNDAVIVAQGVTFSQPITVAKNANVTIIGATFDAPVVVG